MHKSIIFNAPLAEKIIGPTSIVARSLLPAMIKQLCVSITLCCVACRGVPRKNWTTWYRECTHSLHRRGTGATSATYVRPIWAARCRIQSANRSRQHRYIRLHYATNLTAASWILKGQVFFLSSGKVSILQWECLTQMKKSQISYRVYINKTKQNKNSTHSPLTLWHLTKNVRCY